MGTEDLKLHAEERRAAQQAKLESGQSQRDAQLSMVSQKAQLADQRLADEAEMEKEQLYHDAALAQSTAKASALLDAERQKLELEQARNAEQLKMMREMKELGVDLTKVLVSQHEQPDRVIKLDTGGAASAGAAPKGLLSALQLNI